MNNCRLWGKNKLKILRMCLENSWKVSSFCSEINFANVDIIISWLIT